MTLPRHAVPFGQYRNTRKQVTDRAESVVPPHAMMELVDPAEDWQKFLSSFPESFRSLATADLNISGATFSVHQEILSLHSGVFSDLFTSCARSSKLPRLCVPLENDDPADAVACLQLLYRHAKGAAKESELITAVSQAVRVARFAHKYAADLQLETCDSFLHKQVAAVSLGSNKTSLYPHDPSAWGPLQCIDFAEQHGLKKTLAAWECWVISHFEEVKQDILGSENKISFRSLTRICRGLHESYAPRARQLAGVGGLFNPTYCTHGHLSCTFCASKAQATGPSTTISMETLLSWQQ